MNMETESGVRLNLNQQQALVQQQFHQNMSQNLIQQQQLLHQSKQKQRTDEMVSNSSMDKNKELLNVKLMSRRPIQQLVEQGIIPPPKQSPGIYEQSKKLERARMEDFLKHKIQRRPDRQALIQQHILEDTTVSPTIHNKQRQLKKARLTDDLNDRLSHRPGPLELVKGNILLTDGKFAQAVKEGQIQFKATSEGELIKHPPPRFIIEEETSSDDSVSPSSSSTLPTALPTFTTVTNTISNNNNNNNQQCQQSKQQQSQPQAQQPIENVATNINSSSTFSSAFSNQISSASSPPSSSTPTPTSTTTGKESGPILTKNRKKSKSKSQPKTKTIKFHEYKGPPSAQKNQSSSNTNTETSYELLLKQQQLFLQWQLEWQNKYPQIIMPSAQKSNLDQSTISNNSAPNNNNTVNNVSGNNNNGVNNSNNGNNIASTTNNINATSSSPSFSNTTTTTAISTTTITTTTTTSTNTTMSSNGTNIVNNCNPHGSISNNNSVTPIMITSSTRPTSAVEMNPSRHQNISAQHVNSSVIGINIGSNNSSANNNTTITTSNTTNSNVNSCTITSTWSNNTNSSNVNYSGVTAKIITKLEDMKVSDLKCELKKLNLPVSGSKPQLIERLKPYVESSMPGNFNSPEIDANSKDNGCIDDPMSNKNINNNAMVIDDSDKISKVIMKTSPLSTPMEMDPIVYTSIPEVTMTDDLQRTQMKKMVDFQNKTTLRSQLTGQTSFQLQFQNQPVYASPTQSVTIQAKLVPINSMTNSQQTNLAAIISPGNASATVKANLAAFIHQQAQQHQQQQQQQQQQLQQQLQQQQQHLHATIGPSSVCLTNPISMTDTSFESTPLLLTSKLCDAQYAQSIGDQQINHQQLIPQPTVGTNNLTGDSRFQVTSDCSNKYHLAFKQSTFSLPLLTQVIDSKNSFPTFHQFLLYPSSLNRVPDQLQQPQQQQQQQHPIIPNVARIKQTRTNSLPTELPSKSISQRTSLPDFSTLINIKTEPNVKPNLTQQQPFHQQPQQLPMQKSQPSAQNHLQQQQQQQHQHNVNLNQNQNQNLIQQQQGQQLSSAKPPPDYEEATKDVFQAREEAKKINQNQAIDDVLEILMKSENLSMAINSSESSSNQINNNGNTNDKRNKSSSNDNNNIKCNDKEDKRTNEETLDSSPSTTSLSFFLSSSSTPVSASSSSSSTSSTSTTVECQAKVIPSSSSQTTRTTITATVNTNDMDEKMDDSNLENFFNKGLEEIANSVCMNSPLVNDDADNNNNNNSNTTNNSSIGKDEMENDIDLVKSSSSSPSLSTPMSAITITATLKEIADDNMVFEINEKGKGTTYNKDIEVNGNKRNTFDSTGSGDLLFNELLDFQGSPMNVDYANWLAEIIPDNNPFKLSSPTTPSTTTITATSIGSSSFSSSSSPVTNLFNQQQQQQQQQTSLFNDSNSIDHNNINNKLRNSHNNLSQNNNSNSTIQNNVYNKPNHHSNHANHSHNHHHHSYHNSSLYHHPMKQHSFSLSPSTPSSPFSSSSITATSMDHDPVLANNLVESCHYGDPLIDLYFDTETDCRESNDLTSLGVWDKVDFAT